MADLKQAPILVVEDTQMIRVLLVRLLKSQGFTNILEASDGQQALDLLASRPVELVLLDINMPVLDGVSTLARIKADQALRDLTIIMVTAVDKIESVAQCIQLGAEDYMPKLFNPILLNARILSCLEKRWLRRELARLSAASSSPVTSA